MGNQANGTKFQHTFTRSEIREAEHLFAERIKKTFGEVWRIKSDGEYKGVSWDCASPLLFSNGLWLLCQRAVHKGAIRAAGRIEARDVNTILRFILLYAPEKLVEPGKIIV